MCQICWLSVSGTFAKVYNQNTVGENGDFQAMYAIIPRNR